MLRSVKYGLYGAVLAGLVAAPVVWNSVDKTVHLVVDGHASTVRTTAAEVGQVVSAKGYRVDSHDLLAPSSTSQVSDGMHVVLRRGRLLHLDIDGRRKDLWTTAPTVADALAQLGYTNTDFVSVSRSRRLPLSPTAIAIRTPRLVTLVHDHQRQSVTTTDATVGQVLHDVGLTLAATDRLTPAATTTVTAGQTITIQRVSTRLVVRKRTVPYSTAHRADATMQTGSTKIVTPGRNGTIAITYSVVYVDGKALGMTRLASRTLAGPRTQLVSVGTKRAVVHVAAGSTSTSSSRGSAGGSSAPSAPAPTPGSAKAIARQLLQARGWGSQNQYDCLVTMWNHESGWRVDAANPSGAYGIPQALPGSKMASAGPNWQTSAKTQITWGLNYIASRYGTPCGAWSTWQANGGWY